MATKKELEDQVAALQRELGSKVGAGARAADAAQAAMNASRAVGEEVRVATRAGNLERRDKQQKALADSGQSLAVGHAPVTQPNPPVIERAVVEDDEADEDAVG